MAVPNSLSSIDLMTLSVFKHVLTQRKVWQNNADVFGHVVDKYLQDEINKLEQKGNVDDHDT
jgi:hypothetical protein